VRGVFPTRAWQAKSLSPMYASASTIFPESRVPSNRLTNVQPKSSRATVRVERE
jgi:hypothetical protein